MTIIPQRIRRMCMALKTVETEIKSSYDYFFEIARPNYREFVGSPSVRTALNTAWPLWHIHEWYFWEEKDKGNILVSRKKYGDKLTEDYQDMHLVRDIAEAGKHLRLGREPIEVDRISHDILAGTLGPVGLTSLDGV